MEPWKELRTGKQFASCEILPSSALNSTKNVTLLTKGWLDLWHVCFYIDLWFLKCNISCIFRQCILIFNNVWTEKCTWSFSWVGVNYCILLSLEVQIFAQITTYCVAEYLFRCTNLPKHNLLAFLLTSWRYDNKVGGGVFFFYTFSKFQETWIMSFAGTGWTRLVRTRLIQTSTYLKLLPKSLHLSYLFNVKSTVNSNIVSWKFH